MVEVVDDDEVDETESDLKFGCDVSEDEDDSGLMMMKMMII